MKYSTLFVLCASCALLTGCAKTSRSISHAGYPGQRTYCGGGVSDPAFEYRGELSEYDVLGIPRSEIVSEADIRQALQNSRSFKLRQGSTLLLIQSGALFPDSGIVTGLSQHFRVVPFSGLPTMRRSSTGVVQTESTDPESYSKSLRLTAARAGAEAIVCYWGILESESDRLPTKTVSWVPVVNWLLPDEVQHVRLRLKIAVVDVRTGGWSVFSPQALENARISTSPRRASVDQKQVERLKKLAYEKSVSELVQANN